MLFDDLTPQVTGYVGDVNPTPIALKDKLCKANLTLLQHLLYHLEQLAVISPVACNDICSTTQEVMTILRASHERVQFFAAVS